MLSICLHLQIFQTIYDRCLKFVSR